MISRIRKVQKIANSQASVIQLNTSLPISLRVSEKIGYNRYILNFANKKLNTRSTKPLQIGAEYWGEIGSASENIVITGLFQKPQVEFNSLKDGLSLIETLVNEPNLAWFYEYLKNALASTSDKAIFEIYADMLLALQKNIINIGFEYGGNGGVFQYKKGAKKDEAYLVFSNFAPLLFDIENGEITTIKTPFKKVASLLGSEFSVQTQVAEFSPLWAKNKNLIDFKG